MKFSYFSNELTVNGKKIELFEPPAKIHKIVMPNDNLLIVKMYVRGFESEDYIKNRNIFAVNAQGEVIWQIEEVPAEYCRKDMDTKEPVKQPYIEIGIGQDGVLRTAIPLGYNFDVDPKTGKLSNAVWTK